MRNKGGKPSGENYLRTLKRFARWCRYGSWPLRNDACCGGTLKGRQTTDAILIRAKEWLDGPGALTPGELMVLTYISRICDPPFESVLTHGRTHTGG